MTAPSKLAEPIKTIIDRWIIRTKDIESEGILHINDDIEAIIHFYPKGMIY